MVNAHGIILAMDLTCPTCVKNVVGIYENVTVHNQQEKIDKMPGTNDSSMIRYNERRPL